MVNSSTWFILPYLYWINIRGFLYTIDTVFGTDFTLYTFAWHMPFCFVSSNTKYKIAYSPSKLQVAAVKSILFKTRTLCILTCDYGKSCDCSESSLSDLNWWWHLPMPPCLVSYKTWVSKRTGRKQPKWKNEKIKLLWNSSVIVFFHWPLKRFYTLQGRVLDILCSHSVLQHIHFHT